MALKDGSERMRLLKYLVIDVETTGATNGTKGNPFCPANRLACVGWNVIGSGNGPNISCIEYKLGHNYGHALRTLQQEIDDCDLFITFTKFDLHWLRRYGVRFSHRSYFDIQTAEFILNGQRTVGAGFDSVNKLLDQYGLELKKDEVKEEYWNKGIDTDQVPWDVLEEYTSWDCIQEGKLFLKQLERMREMPSIKRIIHNTCQDLLVTADMEWNGLHYDTTTSLGIAKDLESDIIRIDQKLYDLFPYPFINWNSPEQVSTVLYGGQIVYEVTEPFLFNYKDPRKPSKWKTKKVQKTHTFPRLVEPLENTKLAKEGIFETGDKTLRKLKTVGPSRILTDLLLERRGLEKRIGTWYQGFPKIIQKYNWEDNLLHTNLSHSTARTGRLSSTKPNTQNIEDKVRRCLTTRFPLSLKHQQESTPSVICSTT
jgi:DNA polymerase I-like protein with 3'-5' exonuclease and polymerase domains